MEINQVFLITIISNDVVFDQDVLPLKSFIGESTLNFLIK